MTDGFRDGVKADFSGFSSAAADIVVPILAAVFVAVVSLPPTAALVRFGVRRWLATLTVFFIVMLVGDLAIKAVVRSQPPIESSRAGSVRNHESGDRPDALAA